MIEFDWPERPRRRVSSKGFCMRGGESPTIDIYGAFGLDVVAKEFRSELEQYRDATAIHLAINSEGGDVYDAVPIYNMLTRHPARITATVDGFAMSAASLVLMAADHISVPESATIMIHDPWGMVIGGAESMRHEADILDKLEEGIRRVYSQRTGRTDEDIDELMAAETYMGGTEAVEMGFADEVLPGRSIAACREYGFQFKHEPQWVADRREEAKESRSVARYAARLGLTT